MRLSFSKCCESPESSALSGRCLRGGALLIMLLCTLFFSYGLVAQSIHSAGVSIQARQFGFDAGLWVNANRKNAELQPQWLKNKGKWGALMVGLLRDPREIMVINDRLPESKPFKINKMYHTWVIQPQVGYLIYVSDRKSRTDLGFRIKTGLSLPMAYSWPVHIWFYEPNFVSDGYSDVQYNPSVHVPNQIGGTSSWVGGFKDGSWTPGLGGQLAMEFEWGNYRFLTNSMSIGFNAIGFAKKIPNWYDVSMNRQFFPSVFATFAVGINTQKQP